MRLILKPYIDSSRDVIELDVDPKVTVEHVIKSYRHHFHMSKTRKVMMLDENEVPLQKLRTLEELNVTEGQRFKIGYKDEMPRPPRRGAMLVTGMIIAIIFIMCILAASIYLTIRAGKKELILMFEFNETFQNSSDIIYSHRKSTIWCENPFSKRSKYGIIVDGGTIRTCIMLYSWDEEKFQGTGCVKEQEKCCLKGGLIDRPDEDLGNHIARIMICVTSLLEKTDSENKDEIPIYFAATGSMRLRWLSDLSNAMYIMDFIKGGISRKFISAKTIEVISGENEALYRWIATNYLRNTFRDNVKDENRYGSLNLAENSLAISFEKPDWLVDEEVPNKTVTIFGKEYNVLAENLNCFGRTEARSRYRSFLVMQNVYRTEVEDPCMPVKSYTKTPGEKLFQRVCTHNSIFTAAMRKTPRVVQKMYVFRGTGHSAHCRGNISLILNANLCGRLAFSECFTRIQIPKYLTYVAYSLFYETVEFFNATGKTLDVFERNIEEFCTRDMKEVNLFSISKKRRSQICFDAYYTLVLLTVGFELDKYYWKNIMFVGDSYGEDLVWPLGYMVRMSTDL